MTTADTADDLSVQFRTDHEITTADGLATLEDVRDLHDIEDDGTTGDGITVAVMDSGIDDSHPVFDGMDISHYDCTGTGVDDYVGHGTGVAGLIAQLAPDVELISVKIFGHEGSTSGDVILDAYDYLIDHADEIDLVNMSWGARSRSTTLDNTHAELLSAGVQDVVAAGNTSEEGGSPATAMDAFSAGAVTEDGEMTHFSSHNPDRENPDVSALGKDVKLARAEGTSMGSPIDEQWTKASGTSFAAPIVTALAARMMEVAPREDPKETFEGNADDIPQTPRDGHGIVDYDETLDEVTAPESSAYVFTFNGSSTAYFHDAWIGTGRYMTRLLESRDGGESDRLIVEFRRQDN